MALYPPELINILKNGEIAIIRTDTIYGIVGRANNQATVERIFHIKGRAPEKSPIILISDPSEMLDTYDIPTLRALQSYWPGPNSIILPSENGPAWITRGNKSIAYRLPSDTALQALIREVGPLAAPSANPEGLPPAETIEQAKQYFGDAVDYYHDGGIINNLAPSSLFRYDNDAFVQLR
ncbi:MAG TPA: L-threonylcarbamoyladenylate synthase [Candidatus Saccharibacteria bacterium]|nr:L-threonylcarbamoyladenylate synthase [Candidatus Saccharibacteria bacterium]